MSRTSTVRRVIAMALTFCCAYVLASQFLFPENRRAVHGFVESFKPATLEHVRPTLALAVGSKAAVPLLRPIGDSPDGLPRGIFAVTSFDLACRNINRSAEYLNRLAGTLADSGIPYVVFACGTSYEQASAFVQAKNIKAPTYYATCDELDPQMRMHGGIRHYVLDGARTVMDAWQGVPITRYAEKSMTAQVLQATQQRVLN